MFDVLAGSFFLLMALKILIAFPFRWRKHGKAGAWERTHHDIHLARLIVATFYQVFILGMNERQILEKFELEREK